MEFLAWLPKFLAELVYELYSKKHDTNIETKERFADLIEKIADCVYKIGIAIENGDHATSACAELVSYLNEIEHITEALTDKETANQLTLCLHYVDEVPGMAKRDIEDEIISTAKPAFFKFNRFHQSQEVLKVAGTLKAIANLLRV